LALGLPGVNGLEAISLLKQVSPRSLVIVLSALTRDTMARAATERGADGYLEKANLVSQLVPTLTAAVRAEREVP
jgi:DNA-binding NarL/FixJ family response regulator